MNRQALTIGVATFAILFSHVALADDYQDPTSGLYLSVGAGGSVTHDGDLKRKTGNPNYNLSADFDWGWMASGAVGYDYGNFIRNELEVSYRANDVDSIQGAANPKGHAQALGIMYNLLFDMNVFGPDFTPYVGAGIGVMRLDLEGSPVATTLAISESSWVPAYQGIIGAEWALDDGVSLFTDYRYMRSLTYDYKTTNGNEGKYDYSNSTVMAGLRYSFGSDMPQEPAPTPVPVAAAPAAMPAAAAPAYAPPPAAAPAVSRNYNVFFDLNRAKLTPEAAGVIRQAAQDAVNGNAASMRIIGHTDTSGTPEHNQKLSEQRAAAVKEGLSKLGINPAAIQWEARGENDLLVPTADGTREPQNRRAEIRFSSEGQ